MPRLRGRKEEPTNTIQSELVPTKIERPPSPPKPKVYFFEYGKVRLLERDFLRWQEIYPHISVIAELQAAAEWASKQENWFVAMSGLLAKKERQARDRKIESEARGRHSGSSGSTRSMF